MQKSIELYTKIKGEFGTFLDVFCTSIITFAKLEKDGDNIKKLKLRKRGKVERSWGPLTFQICGKQGLFTWSKNVGKGIINSWKEDSYMKEESHSFFFVLFLLG